MGSRRSVQVSIAAVAVACCVAACTPVSKSYEINTGDMTCDEANRHVHDAVTGMDMTITGFKLARPGSPGYVRAVRERKGGTMTGDVTIRCDGAGVHIDASQGGVGQAHEFERGVFLGVTGRADLEIVRDGRGISGVKKREDVTAARSSSSSATSGTGTGRPSAPYGRAEQAAGVRVLLEPVSGFATVLDFEANLAEAGILPVKVTITNGTERAYEFDPRDIVLRRSGSRQRAYPLTPGEAVGLLHDRNRELIGAGKAQASGDMGPVAPTAASELGDVRAATELIPERVLRGARLRPRQTISGFLYYESSTYDRARITMIDVATGETEGFIVEF